MTNQVEALQETNQSLIDQGISLRHSGEEFEKKYEDMKVQKEFGWKMFHKVSNDLHQRDARELEELIEQKNKSTFDPEKEKPNRNDLRNYLISFFSGVLITFGFWMIN